MLRDNVKNKFGRRLITCFFFFSSSGELSLTNFDTERLEEITNRGIRISSNQVTLPAACQYNTPPDSLLLQCIC